MRIISATTFFLLAVLFISIGVGWMSGDLSLTYMLMKRIISIFYNDSLVSIIGLGLFVIGIFFCFAFVFTTVPTKKRE